jgi:hypothetical protein
MSDAIRAESTTITGHDGDEIEAYQAVPLDERRHGGVVVIHHMPGYDRATKGSAATSRKPDVGRSGQVRGSAP